MLCLTKILTDVPDQTYLVHITVLWRYNEAPNASIDRHMLG